MSGAIIDANLLCLLVVGRHDRRAIREHPRLAAFDADDFHIVTTAIDRLGDLILCPAVLAETSNLLAFRQSSRQRDRWLRSLSDVIGFAAERTIPAVDAASDPAYVRLGFTDAVLLTLSQHKQHTLLSDDLALCWEAQRRSLRAINYNHVREGSLRLDDL